MLARRLSVRAALGIGLSVLVLAFAALLLAPAAAGAEEAVPTDETLTRLLRYPDVEGQTLVFVYAGDLWTVGVEGGTARRLTSHEGLELFPKLSPDGRWVAFTGEYSGTPQVHVIPVEGGAPRQLTFHNDVGPLPPRGGVDGRVLDWTPDGERILYLPHRAPWSERIGVPYTVPAAGGMPEPLGPPRGGGGMFSPDGAKLVYTPIEREFRTWKRYHGGQAQDVWIYDLDAPSARRLTDYTGTDNQPVWVGDTVYFSSDRTGKLNLYALDPEAPEGAEPRQVTHHETWDVLWPSAGRETIVYEAGGWIWRFDPATEETAPVPIRVFGDFEETLPYFANVQDDVQGGDVSPTGARALMAARGDLFTAPAEEGEIRNLTRSQGVRERDPAWSPDGSRVAYWSDRTGEYELYVRPADGSGEERRLTTDGAEDPVWRYAARWSPDGTRLAYGDRRTRLRVVDVETGEITDVDSDPRNDITDYRWSPDGRWLAYSKIGDNQLSSVWVHSLEEGESHRLTGEDTNDFQPAWDPKGRYLYFLSDRDFNLTFSGFEFDFLYTNPERVYVGLLTDEAAPLFLPESDEEPTENGEDGGDGDGEDENGEDGEDGEVRVAVEPEGFELRVRAIPGPSGNYGSLSGVAAGVLYLESQSPQGGPSNLQLFDLEAEEEKTILEGVAAYQLAAGGEKVAYAAFGPGGMTYGIAPVQPGQNVEDTKLDLSGLELKIDPRAEWRQEYVDAWRILRDWFYDPDMHGLDWRGLRERYAALVDHLAHRSDLDYVLGELGAELEAGHVYVQPSDDWRIERRENALLGAEIVADPSGHFRVAKIFPGESWHDDFRSPLTEPGVDVNEGDLILAVDGVSTRGVDNVYRLLENKADRAVTLEVAADASGAESRTVRVRPITRETNLRYLDWVESRQRYVAEASGGRIGYIHVPDTAFAGSRELWKGFYAQATKDALIIDDRYNGGGFIPYGMIELLDRPLLSYWSGRNVEPFTTPQFVHRGPKAMLINGNAGSGGDALPYYFRKRGLGPVIGTRTWGGLIGVSGNPSLMDGGVVTAPTFRFIDLSGMWAVEGVGVAPDIEVIDRPDLVAQGIDPSLDKAIEVLLEELEENPVEPLTVPEPPDVE